MRRLIASILLVMIFLSTGSCTSDSRPVSSVFSVNPENTGTLLNGKPFLVIGLRTSNALISDAATQELIDHMDEFGSYGINSFSVFFQGSRFGDIQGYLADATLNPMYAARMGRIIEAANKRNMVILVGILYYSKSKAKWEQWTQEDACRAVANTVQWLHEHNYRNVFVDVNNEHMAHFDDAALIAAGKAVDNRYVISTSGKITPPNADLSLHLGQRNIPGKYYIQSEGTGGGDFKEYGYAGGYWGNYSKDSTVYNYINIGVYPDWLKQAQIAYTQDYLDAGQGFMFASTWLQCVPPHGPQHNPGGDGSQDNPGIRWWLEYVKTQVQPHDKERYQ